MPINISNSGHGISMEILNQSNTSREIEANMSGAAVMYTLEQIRSKYACGSLLMGYTNRSYNMSYVSTLLKQGNAVCFNYCSAVMVGFQISVMQRSQHGRWFSAVGRRQ